MTETFVSAIIYVPLIIALVINVAAAFVRGSLIKIGAFAVYFFAFASWCYTQGIDGNVFSFAYILTVICLLACAVLSIIAAVFTGRKKKSAEVK